MTGASGDCTRSQTAVEEGGQDRPSERTDRNDTLVLSQMNQRGVSPEWTRVDSVRGRQLDVRLSSREDGRLGRPSTPGYKRVFPQFRKEASFVTKSASDIVIHSPSYFSPLSGPVGQMPTVRLSPRQQPSLLRNEDHAKPVTVKIAQPDPLRAPFVRHRSVESVDGNNMSGVDATVLTENVVDALKKRKRSHLEPDENKTQDPEGSFQLSKRRCSRDEDISAPDTQAVRGLKRRALHDGRGDTSETTDISPDVTEGATKKICQNLSPSSRRFGCGARNVIDASYSSHQRWEERMTRAKSLSQSRTANNQDESMPLVEDSGAASSQTSRCSSRFSQISQANSPVQQNEDYRSSHRSDRAQSIQSSGRSTPFNLLPRFHEVDSVQRAPLLVRDGSVKNRVTTLNVLSSLPTSPLPDSESQLSESSKLKSKVEFTADDLERDRDLLNSRASRLMLGFLDTDEQTDEVASTLPSSSTSSFVPGQVSTTFQASGTAPVSTTTAAVDKVSTDEVQTSTDSGINGANVLKPGIAGASLSNTTAILQNPLVPSSEQPQVGFGSVGSVAANAGFNFGSSAGVVSCSASPAVSSVTVSSAGTLATTQDSFGSRLNPGKSFEASDLGLKGSSIGTSTFGTFLVPSYSAPELGSSSRVTGISFGTSAATTAAGSMTTVSVSSCGTASNIPTTVVSFGSLSDTKSTTATPSASKFLGLGDTRAAAGSFGNAVTAGSSSAFGNFAVVAANPATAAKDNAQVVTSGFELGKLTNPQTAAGNIGDAKQLVVPSETKANGLSFGNSCMAQTTASSFSFGNSSNATSNAGGFAFGNSGATHTTASSLAFGTTHKTASGIMFGNSGASKTTASSFEVGNSGSTQTAASTFAFGNSGAMQTTANSLAFGNSASTQITAGGFTFGKSGSTQTTASTSAFGNPGAMQAPASSLAFGNSGTAQTTAGGFAFGSAKTNLTTGSVQTTATSSFAFGNSSSSQMVGSGLTFGNSVNAQTTGSSFAGLTGTPQFSFGKSSTTTNTANPSTASGFAFGNLQQPQANGSKLTTANPFGSSVPIANTFGSNLTTANTFGSNLTTANTFGSNLATSNAFGITQATSNPFSSCTATANPFGGNTTAANPFGTPNNNHGNKPSGLQFNQPDVAATSQSTPQVLRRVLFPATPANNSASGASVPIAPHQQQPAVGFSFFGSKTDGNSNASYSSGAFTFGKNSTSAPAFGSSSTAGGFAFGKTAGSNPLQPASQGFNLQGATQPGTNLQGSNTGFGFQSTALPPGTNSQTANTGFNFNAAAPNFAFGQMSNPPVNGLPSIASFSAGPKFTPGATYGSGTTRNRMKKKGR